MEELLAKGRREERGRSCDLTLKSAELLPDHRELLYIGFSLPERSIEFPSFLYPLTTQNSELYGCYISLFV